MTERHVNAHDAVDNRKLVVVLEFHAGWEEHHSNQLTCSKQLSLSFGRASRCERTDVGAIEQGLAVTRPSGFQRQCPGVRLVQLVGDFVIQVVLNRRFGDWHWLSCEH